MYDELIFFILYDIFSFDFEVHHHGIQVNEEVPSVVFDFWYFVVLFPFEL